MSQRLAALAILFVIGAGLRAASVSLPIDRADNLWRESDLASIARNFDREGMNILYPRVDWRGDGPGYVEMEFPVYPWTIAWLHRLCGLSEAAAGRLLALVFSLLAMATFFTFASYCLPPYGAIGASAFFTLNPLAIEESYRLLADGLMFLFYVVAVYAFVRWIDEETWVRYARALAATACAILAKLPAVHVGLLFTILVLRKYGMRALTLPRLWWFAGASLVAPFLWYSHAYGLWITYGNSIGLSNSYHWVGLDIFTDPRFVGGVGFQELFHVWMPPSVVLVLLGCLYSQSRRAVELGCSWLAVIGLFYVITSRTTHGHAGVYYHVVSVPAVALLVGAGVDAIANARLRWSDRRWVVYVAVASLCATYLWELGVDYLLITDRAEDPLYACARQFAPILSEPGLIVASAFSCGDEPGRPGAVNEPYMFYWLDRKGFNICPEDQSVEALASLAARGAKYFVAEKQGLRIKPGFEAQVRNAFPVLAECNDALLFRLPR